jgi:hypothetical protein
MVLPTFSVGIDSTNRFTVSMGSGSGLTATSGGCTTDDRDAEPVGAEDAEAAGAEGGAAPGSTPSTVTT